MRTGEEEATGKTKTKGAKYVKMEIGHVLQLGMGTNQVV
jgi:hypothetical protein